MALGIAKLIPWYAGPMIAVDGRYLTSPSISIQGAGGAQTEAQQQQAALAVMDFLVAKAESK